MFKQRSSRGPHRRRLSRRRTDSGRMLDQALTRIEAGEIPVSSALVILYQLQQITVELSGTWLSRADLDRLHRAGVDTSNLPPAATVRHHGIERLMRGSARP